jgi:hypothetical protein
VCSWTWIWSTLIYLKVWGVAFHESVLGSPALCFATGLVFRGWTSFHIIHACWSCWGRCYCSRHNLTTTFFIFLLVASITQPGIESSNPCCHSIDKTLHLWSTVLPEWLKVTQLRSSPYFYGTHVHHWSQFSSSYPIKHLLHSRLWRVLTMVYNTQDYWVFWTFPSSGILEYGWGFWLDGFSGVINS